MSGQTYRQRKNSRLKSSYGITVEQYEEMVIRQKGTCLICGDYKPGKLDIDHDHETGKVRGLLCRRCNIGLSKFRDNRLNFARAIQYLNGTLEIIDPETK